MNRNTLFVLLLATLAGTVFAAANDAAVPATSDGLVAVQSRNLGELYLRPGNDLSRYHKIIVDPARASSRRIG